MPRRQKNYSLGPAAIRPGGLLVSVDGKFGGWWDARLFLRLPILIFSINSFIAAGLALLIGFSAGLPRPYWAMLTVYVVAQPLTGALRSKALFRVLGTILGGCAAVALVPPLVNAPELLALALAAWVGLCLYLSLLDRTPRSYIFMLAGYTAAIIGFPTVDAPQAVFDTAVSRVEEIIIGILCATLVHSVFFPREVSAALDARVHGFLRDGRLWIADALTGRHGPREWRERHRLAGDVTELQVLATHLPFDTAALASRTRAVRALQDRLALLLPLVSGIDDRLTALREADAMPSVLNASVDAAIAFVATPSADPAAAENIKAQLAAALSVVDAEHGEPWNRMLATSALVRLGEIVDCWRETLQLVAFLHDPSTGVPPHLDPIVRARARRPLHRDHGLATLSALALMAAVLSCCAFWIAADWPQGATAAMMAAVFSSFYATQDDPGPALMTFMRWTIISLPIAGLYLFLVLPRVSDFPMLLLALSPFYLMAGYLQGDPHQAPRAMPLLLGVTGALALQETFSADFESFVNGNLAQIAGIGAALIATRILRTLGAAFSAQRILKRGRRDLAALAEGRMEADRAAWTSLMLDRLGLIAPRLAMATPDADVSGAHDAMADLRVGLNVIILREIENERAVPGLRSVLDALAGAYRDGRSTASDAALLARIDALIGTTCRSDSAQDRAPRFIAAMAGLRRTLFPAAPAFVMGQG